MRTVAAFLVLAFVQLIHPCLAMDKPASNVFEAIQRDDQKALATLLASPPELLRDILSARNASGATALLYAAYLEREAMLQTLRKAKPKLDFFEACVVGDLPTLRSALARGQDINAFAPDGFNALGLAVFFRQPEAASLLINAGADLNARSKNVSRVGPIHAAVARADLATLGLLLERGANPNLPQQKLVRPIHDAAASGNLAVTAMLLMFGADTTVKTEEGQTPADLARAKGHAELALRLDQYLNR